VICEIEFMPVGTGSKAGDAIILRYGTPVDFKLMLIDGGNAEAGDAIVAHLKNYYGPGVRLEHVLLTHSDADHASGLRTVLKEISVMNLWLHVPWLLAREAVGLFGDTRWTPDGLQNYIRKEYHQRALRSGHRPRLQDVLSIPGSRHRAVPHSFTQ
jgi:glyoxylase-like metal-dependent hydrolase (beta-lactamase superfamily II)